MSGSDRQPRRWTSAEDQTLREQVDTQQAQGAGRDWCQVALALPGRTNKDCRKRWHNSVAEGLKKGQWAKSEDQLLTHGVHRHGYQWTKVATCVVSRSADQCAKRWQQSLDPNLDRTEWREDEDIALLAAVERFGRHWKDIQKQYLPQRSKNCVKNRYSVLTRRNAIQVFTYDDSLGSSSSDPGTPLQMGSVSPAFASMSFNLNGTPAFQQGQIPYHNNGDSSWAWEDISNASVSLPFGQYNPFDVSPWPASQGTFPGPAMPTAADQWIASQSAVEMHYPMQYPSISASYTNGHARPAHSPSAAPSSSLYSTPMTVRSSNTRTPTTGQARMSKHGSGYGYGQYHGHG